MTFSPFYQSICLSIHSLTSVILIPSHNHRTYISLSWISIFFTSFFYWSLPRSTLPCKPLLPTNCLFVFPMSYPLLPLFSSPLFPTLHLYFLQLHPLFLLHHFVALMFLLFRGEPISISSLKHACTQLLSPPHSSAVPKFVLDVAFCYCGK